MDRNPLERVTVVARCGGQDEMSNLLNSA